MAKAKKTRAVARRRPPKTVEVTIFCTTEKSVVWPPYAIVAEGDTVIFRAVNTAAQVSLPKPALLEDVTESVISKIDTTLGEVASFRIKKKGKRRFKIRGKGDLGSIIAPEIVRGYDLPGAYPYSVYCEERGEYAEGGSSPVMLIEPPDKGP